MRRPPVILALYFVLLMAIPPVVLQAAITVTEKYVGATTAAAASYTTDSGGGTGPLPAAVGSSPFSIAAGSILVCGNVRSGATPSTVALTYDSVAMTQLTTAVFDTTYGYSVYWVVGPRSSSHVSIAVAGSLNGTGVACYEVAGVNTGTPVIQAKESGTPASQSDHTITMDSPRTANSVLFSWIAFSSQPATVTEEYAGVAASSILYSSPNTRAKMQWDIGGSDITPVWTSSSNALSMHYGVEIAVAAAAGGTKPQMLMLGVGEQ
jgi:hypothetical protein